MVLKWLNRENGGDADDDDDDDDGRYRRIWKTGNLGVN